MTTMTPERLRGAIEGMVFHSDEDYALVEVFHAAANAWEADRGALQDAMDVTLQYCRDVQKALGLSEET